MFGNLIEESSDGESVAESSKSSRSIKDVTNRDNYIEIEEVTPCPIIPAEITSVPIDEEREQKITSGIGIMNKPEPEF
jgi:hypothetical protein